EDVAAAMAYLLQKDRPLEPAMAEEAAKPAKDKREKSASVATDAPRERTPRRATRHGSEADFEQFLGDDDDTFERRPKPQRIQHDPADDGRAKPLKDYPEIPMERFRIHVGHKDGVTPREVVGAI